MKKNNYLHLFTGLAFAALMAACSAKVPDDKQAQLENLKAEREKISKQITHLESELAKTNPVVETVKAKEVSLSELTPRPFDHYVQTQGQVEAEDNILVSAKTMGIITQVFVNEGQAVSKGQTLAQIDNSLVVRGIEELKSQLEMANTVFERQKNLWDQKIGTEVQFLQAKTNKESLEKRLASMNEQNDMTRIKGTINGTVEEVYVKVGENIAPGMPAVRVVNLSDLKFTANISEAYVSRVKTGNRVKILIPELGKELESKVTFVGQTIDRLSRTFSVEVKLFSFKELRPNMTGVVKVIYYSEPVAIVVPVNTVQEINAEKIVYVAESDGKNLVARKRVVTVAGVYDNQAQIESGLKPGDKLITFGYQGLSDGEFVKN